MGSFLPWWLLIAPAVLLVIDSMTSSKTSSMSSQGAGATPQGKR